MSDPLVRLGELIDPQRRITYGIVQPGPRQPEGSGVPIIRGQDYSDGTVKTTGLYWVLPEISRGYRRSIVKPGDLLISIVGYVGTIAEVPDELDGANLTQTTARLAVDSDVDRRYLFHYLRGVEFQQEVRRLMKGSAQPGLNLADIARMRVRTPSLDEQRRIAEVLDTADDVIRSAEQVIAKHRVMRDGMTRDLLRPRPEWSTLPVGVVIERIESGKSPVAFDRPPGPREWGVLKVSAVRATGFRPTESKTLKPGQIRPADEVKPGDVLITRANTPDLVGMCCYVEATRPGLQLSDKTLRLVARASCVDPRFLALTLQSTSIRRQIERDGTGSSGSMKNISQAEIRALEAAWPSIDDQRAVVEQISSIDERLRTELAAVEKLRSLRSGLATDLLSGRVRMGAAG